MRVMVAVLAVGVLGCGSTMAVPDAAVGIDARAIDAEADDASMSGPCASGEICDGTTGLCEGSVLCGPDHPCPDALVGVMRETVVVPLTMPVCRTSRADHPSFDDGAPRTWEIDGITRAACVHVPATATASTPRPLVVYLHGAGGSASAVYDNTLLREKADTFDLAGDGIPGFVLASHQGRNMENQNGNPPASRHDVFYRRFEGAVENADARSLDRLIDDLVATGLVDPARIHVIGWSNGAFFGQQYALFRSRAPTPGGHRIASVVAFDGADPFAAPTAADTGCALLDTPRSALPIFLVHRACSVVGCDAAQSSALGLDPGFDVTAWRVRLEGEIGATVEETIVRGDGTIGTCERVCTMAQAFLQHVRWPDGIADGSGIDHEPEMLEFLRDHRLP